MKNFEKIGIVYNSEIEKSQTLALKIQEKFKNSKVFSLNNLKDDVDLILTIGGDGSFLCTSRYYSSKNIPILGINMGRLGYLSQIKPNEIDIIIQKLKNNDFIIEKRLMLKSGNNVALNDIVVKGQNCARTSTLDLFINNKLLCSYVADGVIISTPTGTTAYSLSAGGPIISPTLNCFLIIPICPHTLNTRPIVIPNNEKIIIKSHEKENLNVSYDGQVDIIVKNEIKIEKNENYTSI